MVEADGREEARDNAYFGQNLRRGKQVSFVLYKFRRHFSRSLNLVTLEAVSQAFLATKVASLCGNWLSRDHINYGPCRL